MIQQKEDQRPCRLLIKINRRSSDEIIRSQFESYNANEAITHLTDAFEDTGCVIKTIVKKIGKQLELELITTCDCREKIVDVLQGFFGHLQIRFNVSYEKDKNSFMLYKPIHKSRE